jgi:hypothetical protein
MIITLQSQYLDRYLWLVQDKDGLSYPQVDSGPAPATPDEPTYINVPYPEINDLPGQSLSVTFDGVTVANRLWVVLSASNIFTQQFQRAFKGLKNFG